MASTYDEDLFEGTKMTFGEHLEDLRASLLKAVAALMIGFLVGLWAGPWVVRRIQDPVVHALQRFSTQKTIDHYLDDLQSRGQPLPSEEQRDLIAQSIKREGLIGEPVLLDPSSILRALKTAYPKSLGKMELPEAEAGAIPRREDMIQVFMWKPLENSQQGRMKVLGTQEGFMIYIKASIVAGIIFSSPFVFYFLWQFVAAGLYPHEKKYVHLFMPMSIGLFLAGAALAFFVVFKYVLDFLLGFNAWLGLDPELRISEWMSFVLLLPIGFGISFQLPLVMLFLERIGVFNTAIYLAKWRIAVLVIAVISMVLTPADPVSMVLMAAPLTLLYFGGIALCHFLPRGRGPLAELLD